MNTPEVPHVPKPEPEMPGRQGPAGMEVPSLPRPGPEVGGRAPGSGGAAERPDPAEPPAP